MTVVRGGASSGALTAGGRRGGGDADAARGTLLRGVPPVLQGARAMQDTRRVGVMQTACNMQRGRGKG